MKNFTSQYVFRDVVDGPGWTDEEREQISQKHLNHQDLPNNYLSEARKTVRKLRLV